MPNRTGFPVQIARDGSTPARLAENPSLRWPTPVRGQMLRAAVDSEIDDTPEL
jgi:hypothetical protein